MKNFFGLTVHNLKQALHFGCVVGVMGLTITPFLFYFEGFVFPFVTTKTIFVISVTLVTLILYAGLCVLDKTYLPKRNVFTTLLLFFGIITFVTAYTGVDFSRSFWGNIERSLGVFHLFVVFIIFLIQSNVLRTKKQWWFFWFSFLLVSIPISIIGIIQYWNGYFLAFGLERPQSTLGNPIFLALYEMYVFGIALYGMSLLRGIHNLVAKFYAKLFLCFVAALSLITIILTETRSVILGLFTFIVWIGFGIVLFHEKQIYRRIFLGFLLSVTLLAGVLVLFNNSSVLQKVPAVRRFAALEYTTSSSLGSRFNAWNIAIDAWKTRPLLGWGHFNYYYAYNEFYNPRYANFRNSFNATWFDYSHNAYLDALVNYGIVGFIFYILIFISAIWQSIRASRMGRISITSAFILSGVVIAHAVHNIFVFDTITSLLSLIFLLGYMQWLVLDHKKNHVSTPSSIRSATGVMVVVMLCVVVLAHPSVWGVGRSMNILFKANTGVSNTGDATKWFVDFQNMMALPLPVPLRNDIRELMARTLTRMTLTEQSDLKTLQSVFSYTISHMKEATRTQPKDPQYQYVLAMLYYRAYELMPVRFAEAPELADQHFLKSIDASFGRQQLYVLWAAEKSKVGDSAEVDRIMSKARALAPSAAYVLQLYAGLLDPQVSQYIPKIAVMRTIAMRLVPELLFPIERIVTSVGMLGTADSLNGVVSLEGVLSCNDLDGAYPCPYNPIRKFDIPINVFIALDDYYRRVGNTKRMEEIREIQEEYRIRVTSGT